MKKVICISIILFVVCFIFLQQTSIVNATSWSTYTEGQWNPNFQNTSSKKLDDKIGVILGVIRTIGIVVSVVALMAIGIKELTGSVEEKSVIKQALPGYVLGVILVVAITFLPSFIYDIVNQKQPVEGESPGVTTRDRWTVREETQ